MKPPVAFLILIVIYTATKGLALATFVNPPSGSVIANFEGAVNASTLTCNITNTAGFMTSTAWFVQNFGRSGLLQTIINDFFPEVFSVGGDPVPTDPTRTFRNQLTLLNFTAELDGATLYCGTGQNREQANFFLRVYRPPMLQDNIVLKVEESSGRIPVDLSESLAAFPEPMFQWSRNGQLLNGPRPALMYNSVTFDNIQRADGGNYTVMATNFVLNSTTEQVGNDTGSFYLDVLYGPILTPGPLRHYVLLNESLALVCGSDLASNPQASVTWMAPNGTTIIDSARYDLENGPQLVRLNFTHTIPSDSGIWKCRILVESEQDVVIDGQLVRRDLFPIGQVMVDVELVVIAPPGPPLNLNVDSSTATSFILYWEAPLEFNSPISLYTVSARNLNSTGGGNDVVTRNTTNSSTLFTAVPDLLPGTTYELTVVAVSQGGDVVARSQPSDPIVDTTGVTVPELFCNASVSSNDTVTVIWTYIHTGGLPLTIISVSYYSFDSGLNPIPIPLISVDTTSVTIPDLKAGFEYTFNVTAVNSEGSSSTICGLIIPKSALSDNNNMNLIAAIVGGVVGGLVSILLIALLGFGIAAVIQLGLRKRGDQIKLKAVYEDPDNLQQYTPKKDIELEECPAYVEKKKGEIELKECPAYGQAKKDEDINLEECPAYIERKDDIKLEECLAYGQQYL